jgi:hypothetical protein
MEHPFFQIGDRVVLIANLPNEGEGDPNGNQLGRGRAGFSPRLGRYLLA